jgi:hypothetical protein
MTVRIEVEPEPEAITQLVAAPSATCAGYA